MAMASRLLRVAFVRPGVLALGSSAGGQCARGPVDVDAIARRSKCP
jgi:hypothetical protein